MNSPVVNKEKVLIVEDSELALDIIQKILGDKYELKVARSLREGRSKIGNNHFAMILLDVNLPDGNGFVFYEELIRLGHGNSPVIFISSDTTTENILRGLELGQCDFIFKPFKAEELLARVETQIAVYQRYLKNIDLEKKLLKGEFGHEINNPLMIILNSYLSLKKKHNHFKDDRHAEMLEHNIDRLVNITKSYSKIKL